MANLLDRASVVLTPTAYNNGEALCIKPDDGSGDFDFSRATDATRVNAQGLIETIGINLPRINYENGCGHYLWEPQSTNLITYSEDFSQWAPTGTPIITSDYGVSPDGNQNSTRVEFDLDERIRSSFSASGDITFSVYLKGSGVITLRDNTNVYRQNVTLTSEWVRYELSFNATITSIQIQNQTASIVDCEIWGAQVEEQSYATSYIPTSGSSVTRNQDVCTNGGSLATINSTEGTLYFEGATLSNENVQRWIALSDGTHNNTIKLGFLNSATEYKIAFDVRVGGVNQAFLPYNFGTVAPTFKKFAVKYKQNDFALWIDGVEVATDTSGNTPIGLSELAFDRGDGGQDFFGKTKALAVWKEALSDQELTELTTI